MARDSFADLPTELFLKVVSELSLTDSKSLSATNRQIRELVVPEVFAGIRATDKPEDSDDILHVLEKYSHHIKKVTVTCYMANGIDDDLKEDEKEKDRLTELDKQIDENSDLTLDDLTHLNPLDKTSEALQTILTGSRYPDIKALELRFWIYRLFSYDEEREEGKNVVWLMGDYPPLAVVEASHSSWRRDYAHIFYLLAQNSQINSLALINFAPKQCTILGTKEWHELLSRLSNLEITFWGGDNGAGWHSNTLLEEDNPMFLPLMNELIFDHCTSLERLAFVSHPGNPIGCEGRNHTPFPFTDAEDYLPKLKTLQLEYSIIDPAVIDFLKAHAKTLRTLRLISCSSAWNRAHYTLAENGIKWEEIFASLIKSGVPSMRELVVTAGKKVPGEENDKGNEAVLFYVILDDKYGMVFDGRTDDDAEEPDDDRDGDGQAHATGRKQDLAEFRKLNDLVQELRKKDGLEPFDQKTWINMYGTEERGHYWSIVPDE